MAYICSNCKKGTVHGASRSHRRGVAGKRWKKRAQEIKRLFKPNLQKHDGVLLCTKCIKKLNNPLLGKKEK